MGQVEPAGARPDAAIILSEELILVFLGATLGRARNPEDRHAVDLAVQIWQSLSAGSDLRSA